METAITQKKPSNKKQMIQTIGLLIVLGLAIHFLMPQIKSFRQAFQIISQMKWQFILLAIFAEIISYIGVGYSMHSLAAIYRQKLPITLGILIFTAGSSVGLVAGGMFGTIFAIAHWIKNEGSDLKTASVLGILPSFLNTAFIALLSLFSLTHLLIVHELSKLEIIIFTVVLMILFVIVGFVIWGMRYHEQFLNNLHRLTVWVKTKLHRPLESEEIVDKARQAFIALDEIRNGKWHLPVVGAIIYIVFDNLALFFLFYAAGHPVSILEVLSGYGLPLLMGKAAFILPGGLGIVETTMTAIFRGYGVPGSTAFAVVLVYRFLSFWFTAVMGYLLVFFLNHKTNNKSS
jgi:uncharacterized protein (TIRG00374 family)